MSNFDFKQQLLSNSEYLKPFAITLTHDQEKAKDLLQETFFRALTYKDKYKAGTNIKAWLYTIMRNIFINEYRRNAKQRVVLDNGDNDYLINTTKNTVVNDAISSIGEKEIWVAIDKLPNVFKHPFLLYYHGAKYQHIAEQMHEPLGTIKSRIHFARKLLKQYLQKREMFGLN
jgi:RNA polymerase sigma factor (sigma-70 family)